MTNIPAAALPKIASAGRWLFWLWLAYTVVWTYAHILMRGFVRMNPVARSTAWERFKWHFPSVFENLCLVLPLIPLYLFQFHLRAGCKLADPVRIDKGLRYLYIYLLTLALAYGLKLLFEYGIEQVW